MQCTIVINRKPNHASELLSARGRRFVQNFTKNYALHNTGRRNEIENPKTVCMCPDKCDEGNAMRASDVYCQCAKPKQLMAKRREKEREGKLLRYSLVSPKAPLSIPSGLPMLPLVLPRHPLVFPRPP